VNTGRQELLSYFARREAQLAARERTNPGGRTLRKVAKRLVPPKFHYGVRRVVTAVLVPRERRRARQLARRFPLLLHLGFGGYRKEGWVNVDLIGDRGDLVWDVRRPLPFPNETVDAIFHEHLLEHLLAREGFALLLDSVRVLRPGGILRVGVPDAGAYTSLDPNDRQGFLERVRPGRPTPLLAMQEVFYEPDHHTMYDFETLAYFLRAAGFPDPEHRGFGESRLSPCPDSEHREAETLWVEAIKPSS
jgi:SAM-dependent methyltransferase